MYRRNECTNLISCHSSQIPLAQNQLNYQLAPGLTCSWSYVWMDNYLDLNCMRVIGHFSVLRLWNESHSGFPSDSPPKPTEKNESLPKPLIFNIFSAKNGCRYYFSPFARVVKKRVITPSSSESGVVTFYPEVKSGKPTAMGTPPISPTYSSVVVPPPHHVWHDGINRPLVLCWRMTT